MDITFEKFVGDKILYRIDLGMGTIVPYETCRKCLQALEEPGEDATVLFKDEFTDLYICAKLPNKDIILDEIHRDVEAGQIPYSQFIEDYGYGSVTTKSLQEYMRCYDLAQLSKNYLN